ncbi:MAG TPA: ABC transporter ATP-binding protein [Thermopolyspora sp.]
MAIIEVNRLRKLYGNQVAVDDISFDVEHGEIFGIVGPNGAGKTTTVECLAGLRIPESGTIAINGLDPVRDRTEIRRCVGVQTQSSALPEKLKVWEAVHLYGSFYHRPADTERLLGEVGLKEKRATRYGKLSGGQKQRLSITLALVGDPRIAILDELTTGLDPQARRDTWELIEQVRDRGITVVLVTHSMEEAERLCDRVAVIDRGRVVAVDSPAGLVRRAGSGERVCFRPSAPIDDRLLTDLPGVTRVSHDSDHLIVTGAGDLTVAVLTALVGHGVRALDLRVAQSTLEDAFLTLTGHPLEVRHE